MIRHKKELYKGNFNYQGQMFELHKYAYSRKHSFWLFTKELAEEIGISPTAVRAYFSDPARDNHRIERITKRGKQRTKTIEEDIKEKVLEEDVDREMIGDDVDLGLGNIGNK